MTISTALPLPALVGLEAAQQALLLLAVEPELRGLVLAAPAGTGKSSLARGLRALLDDDAPFVELPLSADEEGLLGGLDMEPTLRSGVGEQLATVAITDEQVAFLVSAALAFGVEGQRAVRLLIALQ